MVQDELLDRRLGYVHADLASDKWILSLFPQDCRAFVVTEFLEIEE